VLKAPTLGGNGDICHEESPNLDLGSTPFGLATALAPDRTWWRET